jgi:hypothetical protein
MRPFVLSEVSPALTGQGVKQETAGSPSGLSSVFSVAADYNVTH